jgi:hypothetical protein
MSQDMLGSIRRALPKLPRKHLGLVRDVVHKLGGDDCDAVHKSVAPALREKPAPVVKDAALTLVKSVLLAATSARNTAECLVDDIYGYRDPDIDCRLRKQQLGKKAGKVSVYAFAKAMSFATTARAVVKVGEDVSLERVRKLLKKRKHTITLPQLEILIEKQEKFFRGEVGGEDVGLRTDGWSNFAFVENEDGSVSVVLVGRLDDGWGRGVSSLGIDYVWNAGGRLVLSNSVASTL